MQDDEPRRTEFLRDQTTFVVVMGNEEIYKGIDDLPSRTFYKAVRLRRNAIICIISYETLSSTYHKVHSLKDTFNVKQRLND